jgi:hypothetical protein
MTIMRAPPARFLVNEPLAQPVAGGLVDLPERDALGR